MHSGQLVFAQLMAHLPLTTFRRCVARYDGNHKAESFSCPDQFLVLAFAQLTYRESLRDIQASRRAHSNKLYHMGIRGPIARNTLANANAVRDWRIYADFSQRLITTERRLYVGEHLGLGFKDTVYALDTTTIDLCLSLFPWAPFRQTKAAVKLHTLLDLRGNIPTSIHITDGTVHEVNVLDLLIPGADAFYVMDRGFIDFQRLARFDQAGAFFVTRAKTKMTFRRKSGDNVDKGTGLHCDQRIGLTGYYSRNAYPQALRRVRLKDPDTGKTLVFITNHFGLPALTVCQIYRLRWQVELFFKWIKQHLRIKTFYGTTENAVKTQIWSAVCVYVLVAIVRKRLRLEASMHEILQVLSLTLFERTPLNQLLTFEPLGANKPENPNQLNLFE